MTEAFRVTLTHPERPTTKYRIRRTALGYHIQRKGWFFWSDCDRFSRPSSIMGEPSVWHTRHYGTLELAVDGLTSLIVLLRTKPETVHEVEV